MLLMKDFLYIFIDAPTHSHPTYRGHITMYLDNLLLDHHVCCHSCKLDGKLEYYSNYIEMATSCIKNHKLLTVSLLHKAAEHY